MGVSRLDSFKLLNAQAGNTTGGLTATEQFFIGPVNGLATILASGTFGGGTLVMEVYDGANWIAPATSPVSLTGPGALTWQGTALGVRAKLTGSTSPVLTAVAIMVDYGG